MEEMYTAPIAISDSALEFWARKIVKESFSTTLKVREVLQDVIRQSSIYDHGVALCIATYDPDRQALLVEAVSPRLVNRIPVASALSFQGPSFGAFMECKPYIGRVVQEMNHTLGPGLKRQCTVPIHRQGKSIGVLIAYHTDAQGFQLGGQRRLEALGHVLYNQLRTRLLRERFIRLEPKVLSAVS